VQTNVSKTVEFPNVKPLERSPRSSLPPEWLDQDAPTAPTTENSIPVAPASRAKDRALLTILTGLNAGQVFTLDRRETTIGRSKEAHVRIDEAGISRAHARIVQTEDGRFIVEDLRSTNGLFVNGARVTRGELGTSDRIQVGPNVVFRFALLDAEEEELARQLFESSTRDALTRAFNRKYLAERLSAEVAYAGRHGTTLSVILLDLDHFKRVNDSHGHQAGDAVLRVVAAQISRLIRAEDVFARYGGEEFLVIVRGIAHANVALFAERIRKAVEQLSIPIGDVRLRASISMGVASLSECPTRSVESLLQLADQRLYEAKAAGRNRVAS
jgi:two-component system, cell cycle response regulator